MIAEEKLNPTKRIFGDDSFFKISEILDQLKPKSILLVSGMHSFKASPYYQHIKNLLKDYDSFETLPVMASPTSEFLKEIYEDIKSKPIDVIISIGGGSVLDVSKTLAALKANPQTSIDQLFKEGATFKAPAIPMIAVPTTSGTGSEVTQYASFETLDKTKQSLQAPELFPLYAIVDPKLTYSMSPYVSASSGMDALSQAIESYWAVAHTDFSDQYALHAAKIIYENLNKTIENPNDENARRQMSLGSMEAGIGISQTKTTAVHSVSYPITTYFGVAHGHACALTLAEFICYNAPALEERGPRLWNCFGETSAEGTAKKIEHLMDKIALNRKLSSFSIDKAGIELIIKNGFRPDRVKNNPRMLTENHLRMILTKLI